MRIVNLLIVLFLASNIIFSMSAIFDTRLWDNIYFWYQDTAGSGWLVWYWIYLSNYSYRGRILPVLVFSILIFIWDIISYTTGVGINHPTATGIVFLMGMAIVTAFMIIDMYQKWKQKD